MTRVGMFLEAFAVWLAPKVERVLQLSVRERVGNHRPLPGRWMPVYDIPAFGPRHCVNVPSMAVA